MFVTSLVFCSFFSPQLILQKSNDQFQRNLSFFKVPERVQFFQWGRGGGGSNSLFPIETHITCDIPVGGSGPPVPPLDPHLLLQLHYNLISGPEVIKLFFMLNSAEH